MGSVLYLILMPTVILKLFGGQGTGRTKRRLSAPFGEHKNGIRFSPFAELVFSFLTYVLLPFLTNMTTSCKNQGVLFIQTIKRLTEKNIWLVTRRFLIWINEQSTG